MPPAVVHLMGWHSHQYGSFERFLVALAARCAEAGIASHFVFPSPPASPAFAAGLAAEIHVLPASRAPGDPRFVAGLRRVLGRTGATHLHAHFGLDAMNAVAVGRSAGVAARFATKHVSPGSRRSAAGLRHRWLAAQVRLVFASSEAVGRDLVELGVPAGKVEVAYLGVDTDAYRPSPELRASVREELGVPDGRAIVLSCSHLRPGTGVQQLPGLASGLADRGVDAVVVAAGSGPLEVELRVAATLRGLGPDRFRLLGAREDIPRLLAAADAYVFAATESEGFPLAPLEAASAGAATVATAVSDLPRVLGSVARIVASGNADSLIGACVDTLSDPNRAALGERSRRHVLEHLDVRRSAALHVERYSAAG
jgi:glycosyltransferase involved in cell wall biosynthesis